MKTQTEAYLKGFKQGTTHIYDGNTFAEGSDECFDWEEGWMAGDAGGDKPLKRSSQAADDAVRAEEEGEL